MNRRAFLFGTAAVVAAHAIKAFPSFIEQHDKFVSFEMGNEWTLGPGQPDMTGIETLMDLVNRYAIHPTQMYVSKDQYDAWLTYEKEKIPFYSEERE